jgi:hypothetical protein
MRPVGNYRTLMYDTPRRRLSVHKKPHRTGGQAREKPGRSSEGDEGRPAQQRNCNAL